jgi:hypothetical protein
MHGGQEKHTGQVTSASHGTAFLRQASVGSSIVQFRAAIVNRLVGPLRPRFSFPSTEHKISASHA